MKYAPWIFTFMLLASLVMGACRKVKIDPVVPDCVQSKIDAIANQANYSPLAEVWKWVADDKTYYYFTSDCCDQFNLLYDEECKLVCAPDGGFTGQGDGACPHWATTPIKTLVWRDA